MSVLLDTGAIYALADRSDAWHARMRDHVAQLSESMMIPVTVLPEACYLLNSYLGAPAEAEFLRSLIGGQFLVEPLEGRDLSRSLELLEIYADANLGFVDASLVATAERLGVVRILTTDRRDFLLVRPQHCPAFELIP